MFLSLFMNGSHVFFKFLSTKKSQTSSSDFYIKSVEVKSRHFYTSIKQNSAHTRKKSCSKTKSVFFSNYLKNRRFLVNVHKILLIILAVKKMAVILPSVTLGHLRLQTPGLRVTNPGKKP